MAEPPQAPETPPRSRALELIVGDKYRIESLLGEGGFARVYRARHAKIRQLVYALKVLKQRQVHDNEAVERFTREAEMAATLQSPYVVGVSDFGETAAGLPYIVMEYVEGVTLFDYIQQHGRLRPIEAAEVTLCVLKGLAEAHRKGIVHRDLKPSNVMILMNRDEGEPVAKVADFGIAKVVADAVSGLDESPQTQGGMVFCTPQYAAPEVLTGEPIYQSDLYALGFTLAEMLDGVSPFAGMGAFEVANAQMDDKQVEFSQYTRQSILAPVVARSCAKNLNERYATADEMLEELESAMRKLKAFERKGTRRFPQAMPLPSGPTLASLPPKKSDDDAGGPSLGSLDGSGNDRATVPNPASDEMKDRSSDEVTVAVDSDPLAALDIISLETLAGTTEVIVTEDSDIKTETGGVIVAADFLPPFSIRRSGSEASHADAPSSLEVDSTLALGEMRPPKKRRYQTTVAPAAVGQPSVAYSGVADDDVDAAPPSATEKVERRKRASVPAHASPAASNDGLRYAAYATIAALLLGVVAFLIGRGMADSSDPAASVETPAPVVEAPDFEEPPAPTPVEPVTPERLNQAVSTAQLHIFAARSLAPERARQALERPEDVVLIDPTMTYLASLDPFPAPPEPEPEPEIRRPRPSERRVADVEEPEEDDEPSREYEPEEEEEEPVVIVIDPEAETVEGTEEEEPEEEDDGRGRRGLIRLE